MGPRETSASTSAARQGGPAAPVVEVFAKRLQIQEKLTAQIANTIDEVLRPDTTNTDGLTAGEVKIPIADGSIPGYRAMPQQGHALPTVIVVEDVFGVHEHIRDLCRRFAKEGYFAVAPELYTRVGDVGHTADIPQLLAMVNRAPDKQTLSDLDATVAWAASTGDADTSRLAITGFCRGGRTVWMYAIHNPKVRAAVAWYGPLAYTVPGVMPTSPIDEAAKLKVPVLGLYGGADDGIPQSQIDAMRNALPSGNPSEIVVYPGVPHGFNADYRPSYRAEAAKDGWQRMLAWFKRFGVA